jgi:hypothetical protein
MDGTWYDPILIPVVCSACLAFLIASVVWAAYHPDWKHGGGATGTRPSPPSVLHNRTWLDAERDLGSSEVTGEHEHASGAGGRP